MKPENQEVKEAEICNTPINIFPHTQKMPDSRFKTAVAQLQKRIALNAALARKIETLEKKYAKPFRVVCVAIRQSLEVDEDKKTRQIGFRPERNEANEA